MLKLCSSVLRFLLPASVYTRYRTAALVAFPPNDPAERFNLLTKVAQQLVPKYRFKWPEMSWWDDESFSAYLCQFGELEGRNTDRKWTLGQLLRMIDEVPGDTAECGVYTGASSYLICQANAQASLPREHLLFDSFEGLSDPRPEDGEHWTRGDLACHMDRVRENLSRFDHLQFHQGWIPNEFHHAEHRRFAFVHVDVDLYEPTRDSFEFFYPRMSDGGILVCDDYMYNNCPGATKACDEFLADKPEKMIALCCGGGYMIKGHPIRN